MRITLLSLTLIAAIIFAGFALLIDQSLRNLSREVFQATEEVLVDTANVLAAIAESHVTAEGKMQVDWIRQAFPPALERRFHAPIFEIIKKRVGCHVYLTDEAGLVLYDSEQGQLEGTSLAEMRDVALTLRGIYGARSSRTDLEQEKSSVLHIAAPIRHGDRIIGVLTVRKPKLDQWEILELRQLKIIFSSALIALGILLFCAAVLVWVLRPLRRLTDYALSVSEGKRLPLPSLGGGVEVSALGKAMETMREELEGRDYATRYVQTLTHELKSPLAAIRGTAELLQEPNMTDTDRQRFLSNLQAESDRAERLLRQLLRLSEVERKKVLAQHEVIDLTQLIDSSVEETRPHAANKTVTFHFSPPTQTMVPVLGEQALLHRALLNLLENAVDFSPPGSTVEVTLETNPEDEAVISIRDRGPGLPDYAQPRLFERFYSLKHQLTGRKGTGLGLCFVKEATELHHGRVTLSNHPNGGAIAVLILPLAKG
jgi:two-component system, OmpR family, sensor histidine kinase CreC